MEPLLDPEDRELEQSLLAAGRDIHLSRGMRDKTLAALGVGTAALLGAGTGKAATLLGVKAQTWALVLGVVAVGAGGTAIVSLSEADTEQSTLTVGVPARPATAPRDGIREQDAPERSAIDELPETASGRATDEEPAGTAPPSELPKAASKASLQQESLARGIDARKAGLREELEHLDAASQALRSGSAVAALSRIDEYRRRFPRGKLGLEAETLYIQALAASGRLGEARERAERFLDRYPKSPLSARVKRYTGDP